MLSKYVWLIGVEEISFIWSCDVEDKSDGLHNKGLYHKWQYKVMFFCIKISCIQPWKRMTTSASLCEGPIFYFCLIPYARVMVIFTFPFYILYFGKYLVLERSWYIYPIGCKLAWTIIVDITLGKRLGGNTISPYLPLCPIKTP